MGSSPELMVRLTDTCVEVRPIAGTRPRGATLNADEALEEELLADEKEKAEHVMLVDLGRNDVGRIAEYGSVSVEDYMLVERYSHVMHIVSHVSGRLRQECDAYDVISSCFPAGTLTGAPKLRTMHHIASLETTPRGIYTGAIGHIAPNRQARFSVAIRTALIDREDQTASYGIGAGITWDSDPAAEYRECLAKAQILHRTRPAFELLESLLWEPESGYFLHEEHLDRMENSADYFNYPFDRAKAMTELQKIVKSAPPLPHKVRLLLNKSGEFNSEATTITPPDNNARVSIRIANKTVSANDPFLYHKTTARSVYVDARQSVNDCDEVLLYNEKGEMTEACNANLVVRLDGKLITPPVECGLLAGTLRADLLAKGDIEERIVRLDDLPRCSELYLINSVRRWRRAELLKD